MASLNQEQIFEIAEQILIGTKTWEDFAWLDEDALGKVQVLVKRGPKALAEKQRGKAQSKKLLEKAAKKTRAGGYVFIPERKRANFLSHATAIEFEAFDSACLLNEEPATRRRLFEALHRRLQADEMALWLRDLDQKVWEALAGDLPETVAAEWTQRVNHLPEEVAVYEQEAVQAKASVLAVTFFGACIETSPETKAYLKEYGAKFQERLEEYCTSLPNKMGLLKHLHTFTNVQWTKLAGFTPRPDLACMVDFLPEDIVARLTHPLPAPQKADVSEMVHLHQLKRSKELRAFGEVIQAIKRWGATVNKVVRLSMES